MKKKIKIRKNSTKLTNHKMRVIEHLENHERPHKRIKKTKHNKNVWNNKKVGLDKLI